jgi:DNA invertase Pin-like site-specific DNA recombinase
MDHAKKYGTKSGKPIGRLLGPVRAKHSKDIISMRSLGKSYQEIADKFKISKSMVKATIDKSRVVGPNTI